MIYNILISNSTYKFFFHIFISCYYNKQSEQVLLNDSYMLTTCDILLSIYLKVHSSS